MADLVKEVRVIFSAEIGDGDKLEKNASIFEIGTHLNENKHVGLVYDGNLKIRGEYNIEILYGNKSVLAKKEKLPIGSAMDIVGQVYNRMQGVISAIPLKIGPQLEKVVPDAQTNYSVKLTLASEKEGSVYLGYFIKAKHGTHECGDFVTINE